MVDNNKLAPKRLESEIPYVKVQCGATPKLPLAKKLNKLE